MKNSRSRHHENKLARSNPPPPPPPPPPHHYGQFYLFVGKAHYTVSLTCLNSVLLIRTSGGSRGRARDPPYFSGKCVQRTLVSSPINRLPSKVNLANADTSLCATCCNRPFLSEMKVKSLKSLHQLTVLTVCRCS